MVKAAQSEGELALETTFFFLRFYLFERESACAQVGGGTETEGEAGSRLSREPNVGLDPRTLRA